MGNQCTQCKQSTKQPKDPHTFYRSSEMGLYEIVFRHETAYECINMLGNLAIIQFEDMNKNETAFQRRYVAPVRRCEEIERNLRYVESEMRKAGIEVKDASQIPDSPRQKEIGEIELNLEKYSSDLREENDSIANMKTTLNEMKEMKYILERVQIFFDEGDPELIYVDFISEFNNRANLLTEKGYVLKPETESEKPNQHTIINFRDDADQGSMKVDLMTGVVPRSKTAPMELMLWRISRGNIFIRFYDIEEKLIDPSSGELILKSVFILIFLGEKLRPRVTKVCDGFRAHIYPCPHSFDERRLVTLHTSVDINDLEVTIVEATLARDRILVYVSGHDLAWAVAVRKMKSIYHTMNMLSFEASKTSLVGKCWIPTADVPLVQAALEEGVMRTGSSIPVLLNELETTDEPPTYNKTNKFTRGFQVLVDAYGVANYRELNPAPYYIITFPFLFAVMFGDMGHGLIILIFGLWMVITEKNFMKTRSGNEIWKIFFGGRYIILMMGMFSLYTGFVYNDVFSKAFNIFGSKWSAKNALDERTGGVLSRISEIAISPFAPYNGAGYGYLKEPYPYGVDPIWSMALNKVLFENSFKMKTAIILGFVQMFAGILVSIGNFIFFREYIHIWCEFIPQVLFLTCMFGYLVFLMFYKWLTYGPYDDFPLDKSEACAPMLLMRFIDMLMFKDAQPIVLETTSDGNISCTVDMFPYQGKIQKVLLVILGICVPWMLLTRPLIVTFRQRGEQKRNEGQVELRKGTEGTQESRTAKLTSQDREEDIFSGESNASRNEDVSNAHDGDGDTDGDDGSVERAGDKERGDENTKGDNTGETTLFPKEKRATMVSEGKGDLFINQAIHTIEFVLGSISHTASYLRLWALSLAHKQLSEVLYTMVLSQTLQSFPLVTGNFNFNALKMHTTLLEFSSFFQGLALFLIFAMWATLTFAILVLMEGLSAFLHTLRLHWVEFQSKFYRGVGYRFTPFSYLVILEVLEAERLAA